jgi:hypothetical protein
MGKQLIMSWQAKKKNMDDRVKKYTTPGVSEVIFKDEWEHDEVKDKEEVEKKKENIIRLNESNAPEGYE